VNALFYQFDDAPQVTVDSIARRVVIGLLTSLIVFVPTTTLSIIFRRVRRRVFDTTQEDAPEKLVGDTKLEVRARL